LLRFSKDLNVNKKSDFSEAPFLKTLNPKKILKGIIRFFLISVKPPLQRTFTIFLHLRQLGMMDKYWIYGFEILPEFISMISQIVLINSITYRISIVNLPRTLHHIWQE